MMQTLLLAVEPDSKQSAILKDMAKRQLGASLLVVRSTDEAVAAIDRRVPDLILMSALVPPRDELALNDRLRALAGAEHVQTVSIPLLAHPSQKRARGKRFDSFRRKAAAQNDAAIGCDPSVFGAEIAAYLRQAEEARAAAIETVAEASEEAQVEAQPAPVDDVAPTPHVEEPVAVAVEDERFAIQEETPVVAIVDEPAAQETPMAASEATLDEPAVEETPPAPEPAAPPMHAPIALLEAISRVAPQPPIADDVFREILEEMALPKRIGAGPNDAELAQMACDKPTFYEELGRRRDKAGAKIPRTSDRVERMELWFALPTVPQISLQGFEVPEFRRSEVPKFLSPSVPVCLSTEASQNLETPAPTNLEIQEPRSLGTEELRNRGTEERRNSGTPKVRRPVSAAPDEWGLYNPAACGFEALFEKLEELEAPAVERHAKAEPKPAPADAAPQAAACDNVTDAILQSLRLPPGIAAVSRPAGCRVRKIRKAKRALEARLPVGHRTPEPLIIVSRRMLELG